MSGMGTWGTWSFPAATLSILTGTGSTSITGPPTPASPWHVEAFRSCWGGWTDTGAPTSAEQETEGCVEPVGGATGRPRRVAAPDPGRPVPSPAPSHHGIGLDRSLGPARQEAGSGCG